MPRSKLCGRLGEMIRIARRTLTRPSNLVLLLLAISLGAIIPSPSHLADDSDTDSEQVETSDAESDENATTTNFQFQNTVQVKRDGQTARKFGEEHVARGAGTLNVLKREERLERERNEKRVDEIKRKLEGKHGQASFVAAEEEKKLEYMNRIKQASLQAWTLNMQSAFKQEDAAEPTSDAEERWNGAVDDEGEEEMGIKIRITEEHHAAPQEWHAGRDAKERSTVTAKQLTNGTHATLSEDMQTSLPNQTLANQPQPQTQRANYADATLDEASQALQEAGDDALGEDDDLAQGATHSRQYSQHLKEDGYETPSEEPPVRSDQNPT